MIYEKVLLMNKEDIDKMEGLLLQDEDQFLQNKTQIDTTFLILGHYFGKNEELYAEVKVCSGQNNCYIDAYLSGDGYSELCILSPEGPFLKDYVFTYKNDSYILKIKQIE